MSLLLQPSTTTVVFFFKINAQVLSALLATLLRALDGCLMLA
jgi:hypothetical protein